MVDCAHGANYRVGLRVFQELGAEVIAIGEPAQRHQHQRRLRRHASRRRSRARWSSTSADFGIAFDGDGDRLAMADRDGTLFDGDQLLYAMVKHRAARRSACAAASWARS